MSQPTDDPQAAYQRGQLDAYTRFVEDLEETVKALKREVAKLTPPPSLPQRVPSWPLPQGPQGGEVR
jgi:hypothetical protein